MFVKKRRKKTVHPIAEKLLLVAIETPWLLLTEGWVAAAGATPEGLHLQSSLAATEPEVSFVPPSTEDKSWVEDSKGNDSDADHGGFEDHVGDFLVGNVAAESLRQLGNTVDGSDEDGNNGSC